MKRLFCAVLALFLLFSAAACDSSSGGETVTEKTGTVTRPDLILAENGVSSYVIIRPENASQEEIALSVELRQLFADKYGVDIPLKDDFVREGTQFVAADAEICVGATNRAESVHAMEGLKLKDYRILQEGTRVAIAFGSPEAGREAMDWFIANCLFPEEKLAGVQKGLEHTVLKEYPLDTITIAGKDITEYTVVGPDEFTVPLRNKIAELTGIAVRTALKKPRSGLTISCQQIGGLGPEEQIVQVSENGVTAGTSGEIYPPEDARALLIDMLDKCGGTIAAGVKGDKIVNPDMVFITDDEIAALRAKTDERIKAIRATNDIPKISGTTYYVSPDGDDSNPGTSPEKPWKSLEKVSSYVLKSGDGVLFKRGGVYRGQLKTQVGVTYSAYGTGDKPMIYGSPENSAGAEKWSETDVKNVWKFYKRMSEDVGTIVFNDGEEHAVKCILETGGIDLTTREPFTTYKDLKYDKHFYQVRETGELYLYSDKGNPGTRWKSLEMNVKHNVIGGKNDVTIDNLCVKYGGAHGIGCGTLKNLTVQNCEFGWIGGSIHSWGFAGQASTHATRYGNAVEIYGGCENYKITNCYFYQIYDAAVTHQYDGSGKLVEMKNVEYSGNVMEYCNYSVEYFLSNIEDGNKSMISDVVIRNNLMWYAGYGFCEQRPDKSQDAHIKSWNHSNPTRSGTYYVENNLFAFSRNMLIHIYSSLDGSDPVMSGNTYIQNLNGDIGIFGVRTPNRQKYGVHVKTYISETLGDASATVWFTREPFAGE